MVVLTKADSNRLLVHTFHRKRKKESLSYPDDNVSVENSIAKRRLGDKQSDAPKPQSSSIINDDSSKDCCRMAKIAQRLAPSA